MRRCGHCRITKPLQDFTKSQRKRGMCRQCVSEKNTSYRNPFKVTRVFRTCLGVKCLGEKCFWSINGARICKSCLNIIKNLDNGYGDILVIKSRRSRSV